MAGPDLDFWQARFESQQTPWDRGAPSPQLARWLASGELSLANCRRIAVPGCGAGHEVEALALRAFDVHALDYADAAVALTRERLARAGVRATVEQVDVLKWQPPAPLDAVYEQTCLCALYPDDWIAYAAQLRGWLRPGGRLLALFMQALREGGADGRIEGPPYHCDMNAMRALFPAVDWVWPEPPYPAVPHPRGWNEIAVVLVRR